jgi:hypothetical protein
MIKSYAVLPDGTIKLRNSPDFAYQYLIVSKGTKRSKSEYKIRQWTTRMDLAKKYLRSFEKWNPEVEFVIVSAMQYDQLEEIPNYLDFLPGIRMQAAYRHTQPFLYARLQRVKEEEDYLYDQL